MEFETKELVQEEAELIDKLVALEQDLVMMQEVKSWRDDVVGNFRVISELGKDCAILVPSRWQEAVGDIVHGEYFTLALIGHLACGSIHFAHDRGRQSVWTETLERVETNLGERKSSGKAKGIILGVDLNFMLPRNLENISREVVVDRSVKHPDRLHEIFRFC